jgi:hypothetical protein
LFDHYLFATIESRLNPKSEENAKDFTDLNKNQPASNRTKAIVSCVD